MVFKGLIAATAAISMMAVPAVAAAQSAAIAPAEETIESESQLGTGGFLIPLLALAAIIAGILVVIDDNDEEPASP